MRCVISFSIVIFLIGVRVEFDQCCYVIDVVHFFVHLDSGIFRGRFESLMRNGIWIRWVYFYRIEWFSQAYIVKASSLFRFVGFLPITSSVFFFFFT